MRACTHGGWTHRHRVSTTVLTRKNSHIFLVILTQAHTSGLWISSPTLPTEPPRQPTDEFIRDFAAELPLMPTWPETQTKAISLSSWIIFTVRLKQGGHTLGYVQLEVPKGNQEKSRMIYV